MPAPEMCQRSLVPPGPGHQPGTTSGGGSSVCEELCLKLGETRDRRNSQKTRDSDKHDTG